MMLDRRSPMAQVDRDHDPRTDLDHNLRVFDRLSLLAQVDWDHNSRVLDG